MPRTPFVSLPRRSGGLSQSTRAYGDRQSLATKDEMGGNHTSHLKRPAADPLAKLEKGGGAVWAQRRGQSHPHLW